MKMCLSKTLVSLSLVLLGVEGGVVKKEAHIGRVIAIDKHDGAKLAAVAHHDGVVAAAASKVTGGKIVPPLVDVTTDKKFFGPPFPADYPDDVQPAAERKLFSKTKVYPKVQAEDHFDEDFVKDENSDGGKWKAQQDYDAARTKLANQQSQRENAAKRAANEGRDVDNAEKSAAERQKSEDEASKAARDAEGAEASGRDAEKRARDKVGEKQAAHDAKVAERAKREADKHKTAEEKQKELADEVKESEKALAKEKESFANCQKQLEEAKARVKALEAEEAALKKGESAPPKKQNIHDGVEKEEKAVAEAQAKTKAAEAAHQETLEKLEATHHEAEAAKKELAQQKAEKEAAQASEAKEEKELKEADEELAESRSRLRRTRGPNAVPAGEAEEPTAPPPKAGAVSVGCSAVVAVAVATLLFV